MNLHIVSATKIDHNYAYLDSDNGIYMSKTLDNQEKVKDYIFLTKICILQYLSMYFTNH